MKILEMLESNDPEVFRLGIQSLSEDFWKWISNPLTKIKSPISGELIHSQLYFSIFENALACDKIEFDTNLGLIEVYMYFNKYRYSMAYKISFISLVQQYEDFRFNQ